MSIPVARLNASPARCGGPPVGAAKFSFPGLALAWAISSPMVFARTDGPTVRYIGEREIAAIGLRLVTGS
jgi:hypothetical protein